MNWKPRPLSELEQAIDQLRTENLKLRREVETKQTQVGGLKLALHQRHETIDALRGRIEQLQAQNQQLDQECEHWCQMLANHDKKEVRDSV